MAHRRDHRAVQRGILDPACGSGGMFAQSARFVQEHRKSGADRLSIYGQELIEEYNAGSLNVETFFQQLMAFTRGLEAEEQRSLAEGLTDEQLAIYDLLTRPGPDLTEGEKKQIKRVAEELLAMLKRDKLVLDWRKGQQTRAAVKVEIEQELDQDLPQSYDATLFQEKADVVFAHVFDSYWDDGRSVYSAAA